MSRNWISYANTVRQGLLALEELRKNRAKGDDDVPPFYDYVRVRDAEVDREAEKASGSASVDQMEAGGGQGQEDGDDE